MNRSEIKQMIKFTIPGQPVAKGRPKVTRWGAYTPEKTVNYENLVKFSYIGEHKGKEILEDYLAIEIKFYFKIPKSTSKKKRKQMIEGKIMHNKRPDIDNCIKSITDALNEIAYKDDNQIVEIHAYKYYSEEPRAEVSIESWKG